MALEINGGRGVSVDISRGGLGISPEIIPVGEVIHVKLKTNEDELSLEGQIKWITFKKTPDSDCHVGFAIARAPQAYYKFVDMLQQGEERGGVRN